ncbi:hypothetical protein SNEBB_000224 [Seison nebaliae]|nr:hypothetical protein SNEBB_000224 [Seison nebaliae]
MMRRIQRFSSAAKLLGKSIDEKALSIHDKRWLRLSGMYKKMDDIPGTMSSKKFNRAKDRVRVRAMFFLTFVTIIGNLAYCVWGRHIRDSEELTWGQKKLLHYKSKGAKMVENMHLEK